MTCDRVGQQNHHEVDFQFLGGGVGGVGGRGGGGGGGRVVDHCVGDGVGDGVGGLADRFALCKCISWMALMASLEKG